MMLVSEEFRQEEEMGGSPSSNYRASGRNSLIKRRKGGLISVGSENKER